jgi:hypothetical protein
MMLCAREVLGSGGLPKNMVAELIDVTLALFLSPLVFWLVTTAPVFSSFVFSVLLVTG